MTRTTSASSWFDVIWNVGDGAGGRSIAECVGEGSAVDVGGGLSTLVLEHAMRAAVAQAATMADLKVAADLKAGLAVG